MQTQKNTKVLIPTIPNFKAILDTHHLIYKVSDYCPEHYLMVGPQPDYPGQVIYISVVLFQLQELLEVLVPQFSAEGLTFWVAKDTEAAKGILHGAIGYDNIGKVIMVYLPADRDLTMIIRKLADLTNGFKGPTIPNHVHLAELVYTDAPDDTVSNGITSNSRKLKAFQQKYIVLSTLKENVKGDVLKGIYIKGFMRLGKCVIKEGKKFMWSDDSGKDMKDRLEWQQKIHQDLSSLINIPKIIDLFEENGNTYLVMEFIKGKDLHNIIGNIYNKRSWSQLVPNDKIKLWDLLLQVVEMVEKIHGMGYVHRDLTSANFLLTPKDRLYIIDFELAYGTKLEYPLPVFGIGTTGFMSPEQQLEKKPTEKEDIYGLGALMIMFFTGMSPIKLDLQNPEQVRRSILFFTENVSIATIVAKCIEQSTDERPELDKIKQVIISSLAIQKKLPDKKLNFEIPILPELSAVKKLINSVFEGLTIPELTDNGGLFNIKTQSDFRVGHNKTTTGPGIGLMSPITGILYLIYRAGSCCPSTTIIFFKEYLKKYTDLFVGTNEAVFPGFFYGSAGKAIAIHYGILIGILPNNKENKDMIHHCLSQASSSMDLAHGIAGQVLVILSLYKESPSEFFEAQLAVYINILLDSQKSDGFWEAHPGVGRKLLKSLEIGVSGILISLIKYDTLFPSPQTKIAIEKGLLSLKKNISFGNSTNIEKEQSLMQESSGIALVFLYAYEHLQNVKLKNIAEKILWRFTPYPIIEDYSLANGMLGVGITYIKAAKICKNSEWEKRAAWIYNILVNTAHKKGTDSILWNIGGFNEYDGDLLTGSAGAILFLLEMQELIIEKIT